MDGEVIAVTASPRAVSEPESEVARVTTGVRPAADHAQLVADRAQPVAEGVEVVTLGRGPLATNVYLVTSGEDRVLVDAGWASSVERLAACAEAADGPPVAILLTHIHPDHSGAAGALARRWHVPVYVHPDEVPMAAGRYLPDRSMPLDRWVVVPVMRRLPRRVREQAEAAGDITDVVRELPSDGHVPGLPEWRSVHTPGHTPGHVAYWRPRDGVLLTGDAVLTVDLNSLGGLVAGRPRVAGPPTYTTWQGWAAVQSVGVLADLEPRVLAPGHGRPLTSGAAAELRALARRRGLFGGLEPRYVGTERYRKPPGWYARMQPLGHLLTALGVSPDYMVVLEVPGRRSGQVRRTNVILVEHEGAHYVVAIAGESQWVRNVRAAGGRVILGRGDRRAATLVELPAAQRAPVLRSYLLRAGREPAAVAVLREARNVFGVDRPDLDLLAGVAARYPVLRVSAGWPREPRRPG